MNPRNMLPEAPFRFSSASRTYSSAVQGESLTNLREQHHMKALACLGWLSATLVGMMCTGLLFFGPSLITTLQGENPPIAQAMIGMILCIGAMVGLPYGATFGLFGLISLMRLSWRLRGTANLKRTPREELECENALARLAALVQNSRHLIHWCGSRYDVYERLRDSGQVDRHPDEQVIKTLIEQLAHQVEEETIAVDGLLLTRQSASVEELRGLIRRIESRGDLREIGDRLMQLSTMDPSAQETHYIQTNRYEYPSNPAIGEMLPVLRTRLSFAT